MFDRAALDEKLKAAEGGRQLWLALIREHGVARGDAVVLAPTQDGECNYYGLLYLDPFLDRIGARGALLLAADRRVAESAGLFSRRARAALLPACQAEKLLALYSLYRFSDQLTVLSMSAPYREDIACLMRAKSLTAEDIVATGIYGLGAYRRRGPGGLGAPGAPGGNDGNGDRPNSNGGDHGSNDSSGGNGSGGSGNSGGNGGSHGSSGGVRAGREVFA